MPFTLSHPAAVLPLRRLRILPFAALVAGSVSPDLPYYFTPGKLAYTMDDAHTLPRVVTYCLPASLALLLLWRGLEPLLARILPAGLAALSRRWVHEPLFSPRALPFTAAAALLGVLSHIAWDSFTHLHGFMVNQIPILRAEAAIGFENFRVLQHLSTVAGATALYFFLRQESARNNQPLEWSWSHKWLAWASAGAGAFAFTALTYTADWNYALTANDRRLGFLFVISFVRNACAAVALVAATIPRPR